MTGALLYLRITRAQLAHLLTFCGNYRASLWQVVPPSPERNQTLRVIQVLLGRMERTRELGLAEVDLCLNAEESQVVRQLLWALMQQCRAEEPGEARNQRLAELVMLRLLVERALRTQAQQAYHLEIDSPFA
jgi:hypothetical protein